MDIKEKNDQENWKQDFPYHKENSNLIGRRDFAKMLTLVSGGLALGSGLVAIKGHFFPKEYIKGQHFVCNKQDIPVGGTRTFIIEGSAVPYIMIHLENGSFRAFEQKCTHLSCAVYYEPGSGKIICPCHKGSFDAKTGVVLAGPPPRDLPKLKVLEEGDKLYVTEHNRLKS